MGLKIIIVEILECEEDFFLKFFFETYKVASSAFCLAFLFVYDLVLIQPVLKYYNKKSLCVVEFSIGYIIWNPNMENVLLSDRSVAIM